jgi:diaminopimelate epimerase
MMEIVVADPAKNITLFVLDPVPEKEKRTAISRALLLDPRFKAEQVGFVMPPAGNRSCWRLEMMGGEFCGNAARSFGLYVARETGRRGLALVSIEISGMEGPLTVSADTENGRAEVEIPKPAAIRDIEFEGRRLPLVVFDGIVHAIAADTPAAEETFHRIRAKIEKSCGEAEGLLPDAIGVMFFDAPGPQGAKPVMKPAVYVRATDSLVFESSCGSGTAALAAWETRNAGDGERVLAVKQGGGLIEARVCRENGEITAICIGGPVSLSGKIST